MKIERLVWISKSAQEAELYITDGTYQCISFSQPCEHKEGDIINVPLHAFMVKNVMLSYSEEVFIEQVGVNNLPHRCTAIVVNRNDALVKVGSIVIELDSIIPGGVEEGMLVNFECSRLDLW